ncbi:uncharacterized protein JCM15063_001012 [Sporobolomyces koalae]|uniref:uncharacterized protein n=1 Tax=Sporobolomyces koalae TaxID=500713 RepID=UPI00317E913D
MKVRILPTPVGTVSTGSVAFLLSIVLSSHLPTTWAGGVGQEAAVAVSTRLQARLSQLASTWTSTQTIDSNWHNEAETGDWLITRCPSSQLARIDSKRKCFCGTLADAESNLCDGFNEGNDRRAVCVEDLRQDADDLAKGEDFEMTFSVRKRKQATCGLEFLPGFEPKSCPIGYERIEDAKSRDGHHFICQDSSSPYSCGPTQIDCYAQEGVLRTQCRNGACEAQMCKEGWRYRLTMAIDPTGATIEVSSCVRSKPFFFNSAVDMRV